MFYGFLEILIIHCIMLHEQVLMWMWLLWYTSSIYVPTCKAMIIMHKRFILIVQYMPDHERSMGGHQPHLVFVHFLYTHTRVLVNFCLSVRLSLMFSILSCSLIGFSSYFTLKREKSVVCFERNLVSKLKNRFLLHTRIQLSLSIPTSGTFATGFNTVCVVFHVCLYFKSICW